MSDYISKSKVMEFINNYEKELFKDRKEALEVEDEMVLFAIENQSTSISRIARCVMYEQPTVDEKEIIRKAFEKVVERLEEKAESIYKDKSKGSQFVFLDDINEIVKEEGGIE